MGDVSPTLLFLGGSILFVVLMAGLSALTSRGYGFVSGRLQGVIGLMGSGKSMYVVCRVILPAAKALASKKGLACRHSGRPVKRLITNFSVSLPESIRDRVEVVVLDGNRVWDHLLEIAADNEMQLDAIVIIDECHLYLPSAKAQVAKKAAYVTSMLRKMNAELWWITQSEMKVHKRLRDDTQVIWKVARSSGYITLITGASKWFTAQAFTAETLGRSSAKVIDQRRYRISNAAISAYDSFELIVPDADIDVSLDDLARQRARREELSSAEKTHHPDASNGLSGDRVAIDTDDDITTVL
jgi:hypothetical protein